jgi:hypothetical protein
VRNTAGRLVRTAPAFAGAAAALALAPTPGAAEEPAALPYPVVDCTRAPAVTQSAAIDPVLRVTAVESYFWTSTTHLGGPPPVPIDVHGAGAQRSDPKSGDPAAFPRGRGPQGDDVRIVDYVRCVREASPAARTPGTGTPPR